MELMTIGMLVAGLVLLVVGGELLVRGASSLAAIAGISPLVIGLTVVAFGTSSPELAVSLQAGLSGNSDIAVGNVVGSNIFNVLFILGACALIAPLIVSVQLVRREVPIMIGTSLLAGALALDGTIGVLDGLLLFAGIVGYTTWSIIQSRKETAAAKAEYAAEYGDEKLAPKKSGGQVLIQLGYVLGGLVVLVIGARWLVDSAISIASALGVSDVIIGLTIVAAGTSLPEVVTSIIATLKKERDIAIGNVVGSNIFNLMGILGIAAIFTPGGLNVAPSIINFDLPVMIAVALACLPIFFTGMSIARWEGGLFFFYYVAYTAYLVLAATQHDALPAFSSAMLLAVLPLTAVTLVVLGVRAFVGGNKKGPLNGASAAG
jgi:cation:H+ antiporter